MCEGAFLADLNSHTIYFLALIMSIEMPLTENALFLYKIYLHFYIPPNCPPRQFQRKGQFPSFIPEAAAIHAIVISSSILKPFLITEE